MRQSVLFLLILVIQLACTIFFVFDIAALVFGLPSRALSWEMRELMEIGAALGLMIGVGLGAWALRSVHRRSAHVESQLRAASGAFADLVNDKFTEWGLTPAERDVALFSIKGMSIQEIAGLRKTSEGTVKAQTNAIYRKAGVNGRPQLLSLFIEDLMDESLLP